MAIFPALFSFLLLLSTHMLSLVIAFKPQQPTRIRIRSVSRANRFQLAENERDVSASSFIVFPPRKMILPVALLASSIALTLPSPAAAAGSSNAFLINDSNDNVVVSSSEVKTTTTPGEYLIFSYIGLSGLAGVYGVATTAQKKEQQEK